MGQREENSHVKEIVVVVVVGERGLFSNTEAVKKQAWKWLGRKMIFFPSCHLVVGK